MIHKIEYLEKYAVAPAPSRDYYGLKVLDDEVILFIWKISHGPHHSPTVKVTNFRNFEKSRDTQEEIQRVFGKHILDHVRDIASGNGPNLLTLPKSLILKISEYLSLRDIVRLSNLSRIAKEVFGSAIVWQGLCKRRKKGKLSNEEKVRGMAHGWKELYESSFLNPKKEGVKKAALARTPLKKSYKQMLNKTPLEIVIERPQNSKLRTSMTQIGQNAGGYRVSAKPATGCITKPNVTQNFDFKQNHEISEQLKGHKNIKGTTPTTESTPKTNTVVSKLTNFPPTKEPRKNTYSESTTFAKNGVNELMTLLKENPGSSILNFEKQIFESFETLMGPSKSNPLPISNSKFASNGKTKVKSSNLGKKVQVGKKESLLCFPKKAVIKSQDKRIGVKGENPAGNRSYSWNDKLERVKGKSDGIGRRPQMEIKKIDDREDKRIIAIKNGSKFSKSVEVFKTNSVSKKSGKRAPETLIGKGTDYIDLSKIRSTFSCSNFKNDVFKGNTQKVSNWKM